MANVYEPEWDAERDAAALRLDAGAHRPPDRRASRSARRSSSCRPEPRRSRCTSTTPTRRCSSCWPGARRSRRSPGPAGAGSGEVVSCPAGPDGAHRLTNDTDEPVRVLIVSTMHAPDINEFPETGEYWVRDYVPGTDPPDGALDVHTRPVS